MARTKHVDKHTIKDCSHIVWGERYSRIARRGGHPLKDGSSTDAGNDQMIEQCDNRTEASVLVVSEKAKGVPFLFAVRSIGLRARD